MTIGNSVRPVLIAFPSFSYNPEILFPALAYSLRLSSFSFRSFLSGLLWPRHLSSGQFEAPRVELSGTRAADRREIRMENSCFLLRWPSRGGSKFGCRRFICFYASRRSGMNRLTKLCAIHCIRNMYIYFDAAAVACRARLFRL